MSSPQLAKSSVASLYALKALLAFAVVTWHAPMALPWLTLPGMMVDLFFMITGYFLFSPEVGKVQARLLRSVKKVVPLILVLQVVYYALAPFPLPSLRAEYWVWIRWVLLGFVHFDTGPLWYMNALLYGLLFFWGYLKLFRGRLVWLLPFLVWGWGLWTFVRHFALGEGMVSVFQFNFLTRAVPYLAVGYLLRQYERRLLTYRWINIYFLLAVLSALELLTTGVLFGGDEPFYSFLGGLPLPIALFMLFLSYRSLGEGTWLETIGRDHSANIYYAHQGFILLWKGINASCPSSLMASIYERGGALVVFFLSLGFSYLLVWGGRKLSLWRSLRPF